MRDNLDAKDALIPTSLFLDFLLENGLNVWKGDSTRDLVAISFGYGSRSYDQEIGHLNKLLKEAESDERRVKIQQLIDEANKNKDKYIKISKQELRKKFYTEGVDITYKTHNKAGQVIKTETLHYKMLYRTPGRAKKGDCVFISDRLYDKAHEFLYMGLRLPYDNAPIVEIGAYASLVTSSIVGRIKIEPENIVILKDVVVPFTRNVISIEVNDRNECEAIHRDNYTLKNEEFDGQALISSEIFPDWADGYVLLRQHMTKCAAFCTHIQKYFVDYCAERGIDYETFEIEDMWGNKHIAKDVKLITTNNAVKWLKNFGPVE